MFKLDRGFPKSMAKIPADIDSAFYQRSPKRIIFIKVGTRNIFDLINCIVTSYSLCCV